MQVHAQSDIGYEQLVIVFMPEVCTFSQVS